MKYEVVFTQDNIEHKYGEFEDRSTAAEKARRLEANYDVEAKVKFKLDKKEV